MNLLNNGSSLLPNTRQKPNDDGLIPLINIVLLLLIFFLVAGKITWLGQIKAEAPLSSSNKAISRHEITLALDADNTLFLNNAIVTLDNLPAQLSSQMSTASLPAANIYIHRTKTAAELEALLAVLREQGIRTITLFSRTRNGQ